MNADGSGVRRLTTDGSVEAPAWSPNGRWIAIEIERPNQLWEIHPDGSGLRQLTHVGASSTVAVPAWSPDGKRLAYAVNGNIWVMNADGSGQQQVLDRSTGTAWDPAWSPDGTRIAFDWDIDVNHAGPTATPPEIWVMNANGTGRKRLTHNKVWDNQPTWSPDGKRIAFTSGRGPKGILHIWVMRADGTGARPLTSAPSPGDYQPDWQRRP